MAGVYLVDPKTIRPAVHNHQQAAYQEIIQCAAVDRYGRHTVVSTPDVADIVLAAIERDGYGPFFHHLKQSHLYRRHGDRVFIYCPDDNQYPVLPGVYPSVPPEWANAGWAVGGHYLSTIITKHGFVPTPFAERDILFSFIGSTRTHPVREEIMRLKDDRAVLFDSQPTGATHWWSRSEDEKNALRAKFRETSARSRFVLCPRGIAPSSIRMFEVMEAGCVPVVIADDFVFPSGPNWETFTLRVGEKDVAQIPDIIAQAQSRAETMGQAARTTWEMYFSPESSFDTLVNWMLHLKQNLPPAKRNALTRQIGLGEFTRPANIRTHLRHLKNRLRQ